MNVKLLTKHHLEFLSLKGGCKAGLTLQLSKCHIIGNHMSRLIFSQFFKTFKILFILTCGEDIVAVVYFS